MNKLSKILVIGGSGFIGSYLIRDLLNRDAKIFNFDKNKSNISNKNLKNVIGDVRKADNFKNLPSDIDVVYVLAAEHKDNIKNHKKYYNTNHSGIINIIQYCVNFDINKIVFYSSAAVYGNNFMNAKESEDMKPENHYGKSKRLAELELYKWIKENKLRNLLIIRPSVVYGKGSNSNMNRMIEYINKGKFILVGSGKNTKTVCYVENLVDFTIAVQNLTSDQINIFNYADVPCYNVKDLVSNISTIANRKIIQIPYFIAYSIGCFFDIISFVTNKEINISSNRVKKFCDETSLSIEKIKSLDYKAKYNFIDSINKTIK